MENLPNCPKCNSEYTYEDGSLLVCPECAYEWSQEASYEEEYVIKWFNDNGFNGKVIKQYVSKTIFEIEKEQAQEEAKATMKTIKKAMMLDY